eukprot:10087279-Alexandrium_andersonii.AAC.1
MAARTQSRLRHAPLDSPSSCCCRLPFPGPGSPLPATAGRLLTTRPAAAGCAARTNTTCWTTCWR